jgi:hypothetical protein
VSAEPDEVVVRCEQPVVDEEETAAEEGAGAAEPEVISKGKEDDEAEEKE